MYCRRNLGINKAKEQVLALAFTAITHFISSGSEELTDFPKFGK